MQATCQRRPTWHQYWPEPVSPWSWVILGHPVLLTLLLLLPNKLKETNSKLPSFTGYKAMRIIKVNYDVTCLRLLGKKLRVLGSEVKVVRYLSFNTVCLSSTSVFSWGSAVTRGGRKPDLYFEESGNSGICIREQRVYKSFPDISILWSLSWSYAHNCLPHFLPVKTSTSSLLFISLLVHSSEPPV